MDAGKRWLARKSARSRRLSVDGLPLWVAGMEMDRASSREGSAAAGGESPRVISASRGWSLSSDGTSDVDAPMLVRCGGGIGDCEDEAAIEA